MLRETVSVTSSGPSLSDHTWRYMTDLVFDAFSRLFALPNTRDGPIEPRQGKAQAQNRYGHLAGWVIGMMGDHKAADRSGHRDYRRHKEHAADFAAKVLGHKSRQDQAAEGVKHPRRAYCKARREAQCERSCDKPTLGVDPEGARRHGVLRDEQDAAPAQEKKDRTGDRQRRETRYIRVRCADKTRRQKSVNLFEAMRTMREQEYRAAARREKDPARDRFAAFPPRFTGAGREHRGSDGKRDRAAGEKAVGMQPIPCLNAD